MKEKQCHYCGEMVNTESFTELKFVDDSCGKRKTRCKNCKDEMNTICINCHED